MFSVPVSAPPIACNADRREAETAVALVADYGAAAESEAGRRAARSRKVGNVVHFCRWRRIGRLAALLNGEGEGFTRH